MIDGCLFKWLIYFSSEFADNSLKEHVLLENSKLLDVCFDCDLVVG